MYFSSKEYKLKSLYNILTYIVGFHLKIIALFNKKIDLGVKGRANTFKILKAKISSTDKVMWFHCASLGEFEQARPLIEKIKSHSPEVSILLTFFSPSGYEIRKEYPFADYVCYLPIDTQKNAQEFLSSVKIEKAYFVKYEAHSVFALCLYNANIQL